MLTSTLSNSSEKPVPTRVTIDEHNRFVMNGKPWFPIGLSPGPPLGAKDPTGRDAVAVVAEAGMNCFRLGRGVPAGQEEDWARYLDWSAQHGMFCFPNLHEYSVFDDKHPDRPERLRAIVERFRHHPALAMWKSMDEPAWGKVPTEGLVKAYKYLKEIDTDHPVWMNHAPRNTVELLREYCKACDVTGVDIYPIGVPKGTHSHLSNKDISVVGDYVSWISQAVDGKKPILMVLQVGWSGINPPKPRVFPTFHQERYMAYQAIIKGARALLFFGMPVALSDADYPYGYNWTFWREVLQPLALELGEKSLLHPALLAPNAEISLKVTGADDVEFICRKVGDFLYILAAKREGAEADVRFSDESLIGDVEVMFEGRTLKAVDGSLTDRFAPNDVHVYKVRVQI